MTRLQRWGLGAAVAGLFILLWPAVRALAGQLAAAYLLVGLALPLCGRLERKLPPSLAAGASLVLLGLGTAAMLVALIPPLARQFSQLTESLPELMERLRTWLNTATGVLKARGVDLSAWREEVFSLVSRAAGSVVSVLAGGTTRLVRGAGKMLLSPLFAFYLLKDRRKICGLLLLILPVKWRTRAVRAAREMRRETAGFLRGQLLISGAVGGLTSLALLVTGTPGWLLLGLMMSVMELIPYLGPLLVGIPAVLLSLQNGWIRALWTLGALLLVQQAESSVLSPRLLSGATQLHPLLVLMAITAGGVMAGTLGMLLSLPIVVCARGALRGWRC